MTPVKEMSGLRFGKWLVLKRDGSMRGSQNATWICKCDCGTKRSVKGSRLRAGKSMGCGCDVSEKAKKQLTTHNMTKTAAYRRYRSMINRCENHKDKGYKYYGGRGIKVCQRWRESFELYLADTGPKPKGKSLDRIDNNGDYEPGNVRWATPIQQIHNRRPFMSFVPQSSLSKDA